MTRLRRLRQHQSLLAQHRLYQPHRPLPLLHQQAPAVSAIPTVAQALGEMHQSLPGAKLAQSRKVDHPDEPSVTEPSVHHHGAETALQLALSHLLDLAPQVPFRSVTMSL